MRFPPIDPPVPYEELVRDVPADDFVSVQGRRIFAHVSGDGPGLVLLHGFAASSYSFRSILPLLAKSYRILSIDWYGFGYTERPEAGDAYSLKSQADLVEAVAAERLGAPYHLLGHSFGATIASYLALRDPHLISRLVLMAPAWDFREPPWYFRNAPVFWMGYFLSRLLLSHPEKFHRTTGRAFHRKEVQTREVSEVYRRHIHAEGFQAAFRGFARLMGGRDIRSIEYEKISCPTLVLAGEEDALAPAESARALADRIPGSFFESIPDCGHSLAEEAPLQVTEILGRFLQ